MKTYTKTIWNICACMLIILLGGCADDDIIRNDCGSTLQETESHLISTFSLPEGKTPIQDTREQIFFQLRSLSITPYSSWKVRSGKRGDSFL